MGVSVERTTRDDVVLIERCEPILVSAHDPSARWVTGALSICERAEVAVVVVEPVLGTAEAG